MDQSGHEIPHRSSCRDGALPPLAEKFQSRTITDYNVATLRNSPWVRRTDPEKFSHDLWSFLKLTFSNVRDRPAFDNAKAGNGSDAWRRIVVPVGPRSEQRLHSMHDGVTRLNASKRLADVERDLDKWEADLDEYYRCGGDRLGKRTMVFSAKTIPPPKHGRSGLDGHQELLEVRGIP